MQGLYEKLIKILRLEQSRNWDDSAVIGGLEGFLAFWLSEARAKASTAGERHKVEEVSERLQEYSTLTPGQRQKRAHFVIERLGFTPLSAPGAEEGSPAQAVSNTQTAPAEHQ
ncbi:MAG: hypothetical protein M3220_22235, partial [Chloroflexota bacterium]|nr:hypothetical protein [Chloroflexota bacterium]